MVATIIGLIWLLAGSLCMFFIAAEKDCASGQRWTCKTWFYALGLVLLGPMALVTAVYYWRQR